MYPVETLYQVQNVISRMAIIYGSESMEGKVKGHQ
jgi:hypothetical protein